MTLLLNYVFFLLKTITLASAILITLVGIFALSKNKNKNNNRIIVKHINKYYESLTEELQEDILPADQFKIEKKKRKKAIEILKKSTSKITKNRLFYINFSGDMHASEAESLREKISAILCIATVHDEVLVNIESPGGVVHAYGLCASQLARLRERNIPLIAIVDKVAASGGYLMASVANQIIAAPFAIVGSIGVVAQLPNFHRLLKENHIDFEQITAGEYKRTLTYFGENTPKARNKLQEEIDNIHQLFKQFITQYRPQLDINAVSTGEFWFGTDAIELKLIDKIGTSDDYLLNASQNKDIYEIDYKLPLSFIQKLTRSVAKIKASFGLSSLGGSPFI
ncbi:MAG: protease SohB [Gammaproteobacteria bacterium]|nr:protease SohB [Gammaproteobacteria bacterium]